MAPAGGAEVGTATNTGSTPVGHLLNFLHGLLLMAVFVLAFVGAIYGWEALMEWWAEVQIGPSVLILWAVSVVCWLLFAIGGNVRVRGEDEGRLVDKYGRSE